MKVKYKFDHIDSEADSLSLKAYGVEIAKFKKADFGENWKDLLGQKFELNPYLVGDLDKLTITGLETNNIVCNSNQTKKDLWKEYSRNKIDWKVLNNRLSDIDKTKPIQLSYSYYNNNYFPYSNTETKELIAKANEYSKLDLSLLYIDSGLEDFCRNFLEINNAFVKLPKLVYRNSAGSNLQFDLSSFTNIIEFPVVETLNDVNFYTLIIKDNNFLEQISEDFIMNNAVDTSSSNQYSIHNYLIFKVINCKKFSLLPSFVNEKYFSSFSIEGCENIKYIERVNVRGFADLNINTGSDIEINNLYVDFRDVFRRPPYNNYINKWSFNCVDFGENPVKINYMHLDYHNTDSDSRFINEKLQSNIELGVVCADNVEESRINSGTFFPIKSKAFPYALLNCNLPASTAIPNDYNSVCWVDDINMIESDPFFIYFKKMLSINKFNDIKVNVLNTNISELSVEIPIEISKNPEYPYNLTIDKTDFRFYELSNSGIYRKYYFNTDDFKSPYSKNKSPSVEGTIDNENNKIIFNFKNLYNIKDNKTINLNFYLYGLYSATIDNLPFNGKFLKRIYNVNIVFNLNEGASMSFDFEDDDGNSLNLPLEPSTENTEPSAEQTEQESNE